jgi:hypothetical protein
MSSAANVRERNSRLSASALRRLTSKTAIGMQRAFNRALASESSRRGAERRSTGEMLKGVRIFPYVLIDNRHKRCISRAQGARVSAPEGLVLRASDRVRLVQRRGTRGASRVSFEGDRFDVLI